jgi:hypothetical protein
MKSVLFTILLSDADAKTFRRHLVDLINLDEGILAACLEATPEVRLAQLPRDRRRVAERLASEHQVGLDKAANSLNAMSFLLDCMLRTDIPPTDVVHWADDLVEAGALNESTRPVFERILAEIKSTILPEVRPKLRQRRAAAGVFPCFTGAGYTVEMRAVREESFRRGTSIDEYVPQVVDTTTIASFHLSVDEGAVKDFYFQADEGDIDYLLGTLQAAKKEMDALKGFLRVNQS